MASPEAYALQSTGQEHERNPFMCHTLYVLFQAFDAPRPLPTADARGAPRWRPCGRASGLRRDRPTPSRPRRGGARCGSRRPRPRSGCRSAGSRFPALADKWAIGEFFLGPHTYQACTAFVRLSEAASPLAGAYGNRTHPTRRSQVASVLKTEIGTSQYTFPDWEYRCWPMNPHVPRQRGAARARLRMR